MKRIVLVIAVVLSFAGSARLARADDPVARKACTDAMNADPAFAESVVAVANKELATKIHNYNITYSNLQQDAAARIATNQQHVIMAYAAMWIAAVVFLVFLWRRQQGLKGQIARLSADLDRAVRDDGNAEGKKT